MNLSVSFINLDIVSGTHYSFASRLPIVAYRVRLPREIEKFTLIPG